MKHRCVALLSSLVLLYSVTIFAQSPTLQVSLLTCGAGSELYSCFGHSALRVKDSTSDIVYNYGTFDFSTPNFNWKFMRGELPYYLNDEPFEGFIEMYKVENRSVYEQTLNLSNQEAILIKQYLENNLLPQHKYYHYDFAYDNCSTRMRDVLSKTFKQELIWGKAITPDSCTFRTVINYDLRHLDWERIGINTLFGNSVDKKMSNTESMFLPDYLMKGFATATLHQKPLVNQTVQLLPSALLPSTVNQPFYIFWALCVVIALLSLRPSYNNVLRLFDTLYFLLLGLVGCLILFMWFGTTHICCKYNWNLIWLLPTHVLFAFMLPRTSLQKYISIYAQIGKLISVLVLIFIIFSRQPLFKEAYPLLLLSIIRLQTYAPIITNKALQYFSISTWIKNKMLKIILKRVMR